MADLNYSADIDTRSAQRSLEALKSQIVNFGSAVAGAFAFRELNNLSSRFEDLRTTLQLLYRSESIGANIFDDIKKFAETSIFSVDDLTQTIVKLKAAGIEPTVAQLRLFADVSSVAADSVGALQAITDLYARTTAGGLGLEDLNRLADRGIPVFTILSQRLGLSRLQISEVGKTAEGARVILKALEDGLQDAFGGASASRANNVSQAMSNFGDAVDNAADAMGQAGLNAGLSALIKSLTELINSIKPAIELVGSALGGAFKFLAENIKPAILGATAFFAVMAVSRIVAIVKALSLLNLTLGKGPWAIIARLAAAAGVAVGLMSDGVAELEEEFNKTNKAADDMVKSDGFKVLQDGSLGAGTENLSESVKNLNEGLNKFRVEMNAIVNEFGRYNTQVLNSINLESALLGKSKEYAELKRAEADITQRTSEQVARLLEQKAKLTKEELEQGRGEIIDQTIAKIQQQAEIDSAATAIAIKNSEERQRIRQAELFGIKANIEFQDKLRDIQDDIAKSTMTELEKKYYDIERAAERSALAAIRAEEARIGRPLNTAEQQRYYEEARKGVERLKKVTQEHYEQSRTWSTGWRQAFNDYVENATNAANTASNIFKKVTQGMEDMIVNFVKTGKFEFKSFVNSILEELLRSQIRQVMAQIFQIPGLGVAGNSTGGSLFGSVGKLLGFANGGIIPTNAPVVVGERGPELLMGASGRQVIPNEQLGGSTTVVYNINAVDASSFKSLVAADPGFIHAVAMQGAKSTPGRR
jgi:lambda family phage tail tape measure protein